MRSLTDSDSFLPPDKGLKLQLPVKKKKKKCNIVDSCHFQEKQVKYVPSLIFSDISAPTKDFRATDRAKRMAPACPDGPPPSV